MDDFVLNVRQILQYPQQPVKSTDALLLQTGGLGGPYISAQAKDFFATALNQGGYINFAPGKGGLAWNGAALTWSNGTFLFSEPIAAPAVSAAAMFINGEPVATIPWVRSHEVTSFNFRTGDVLLEIGDILRAGGAPILNPHLLGWCTATSPVDPCLDDDTIATTHWVRCLFPASGAVVRSFDGRGGDVWLSADDITFACTRPGAAPLANNPPSGDASNQIATTFFVDGGLSDLKLYVDNTLSGSTGSLLTGYAPLASPAFTGVPTAPTAAPGVSTGQLATTAFVTAAVIAATAGVATFNTRSGAVVLSAADITAAGGALLASPTFTGTPAAPTATPGTNTTQLATTAFVRAAVTAAGGVASFNTRTGAVVLTTADITGAGGAPIASPVFTGAPAAPTPAAADSSTAIATTAFVKAVIGAGAVSSFNGRGGAVTFQANDISAVGGALLAAPAFTGAPTAPTAAAGTNSTQLATTAFVLQSIAAAGGVASFNGRAGAVTLTLADISAAGGATLASPAFTGTPTVPTAAPGTNNTQAASTAFVQSSALATATPITAYFGGSMTLAALGINVSSFTTAGLATFAAAHGIGKVTLVVVTGSVPGPGFTTNTPYYFMPLSTTTGAFYKLLSDARADLNRVIGGTASGWSMRVVSYSLMVTNGMDADVPIGAWAAHGTIYWEVNLLKPLNGLLAIILMGNIDGVPGTDGVIRNTWMQCAGPNIISTTLIRFDGVWAQSPLVVPSGGGAPVINPGAWSQVGNNATTPIRVNFVIIG